MNSSAPTQFSLIDYLVLSIVLLISSAIGLYYRLVNRHCQVYFTSVKKEKENIIMRRNLRLSGGRQKTSSEYLLADGAMGVIKMPTSQLNICLLHFLIWSTPNSQSSLRLPQLPSLWWPHSCPLSLFLGWPRRTTHTEHRFLAIVYWAFIACDDLIFIQTFQFVAINLANVVATPVATHIFLPVFYRLRAVSVYQ